MPSNYKIIPIKPLTGLLEFRLPLDQMTPDMFRFRENFKCSEQGKLLRSRGWSSFMGGNADFHDQLLPLQTYYQFRNPRITGDSDVTLLPNSTLCGGTLYTRPNGREPITFGMMAQTSTGFRKLIIGSQSRLAVLDEITQNWQIIADGMGNATEFIPRFYADVLNSTVIFTNGVDEPVAYPIGGPPTGCNMQAALHIADFDTIALSAARVVVQFAGVMMLMDITLNGIRYPNGIIWSDFDTPTSWVPSAINATTGAQSVAGNFNLPPGQQILGAVAKGTALYIYTDHGIVKAAPTGDSNVFDFSTTLYSDPNGNKCIAYRNTLCTFGINDFYMGTDGFYVYNPYQMEPERVEWMHSASGIVYNGIPGYQPVDPTYCDATHAIFRPNPGQDAFEKGEGEIWLSWNETGQPFASKTIILNVTHRVASTMEVGFGMFVNYISDNRLSVRDFLLQNCLINTNTLQTMGLGFIKEGQPAITCPPQPQGFVPQSIYTGNVVQVGNLNVFTEDFNWPQADGNSLCAFLHGMTVGDLCLSCNNQRYFIGSYMGDYCLKALDNTYARTICTNPATPTGPGTANQNLNGNYFSFPGQYQQVGYFSTMRSGPLDFSARQLKAIKRVLLDALPFPQAVPCALQLRIGNSYHPADPNYTNTGSVIWRTNPRQLLEETDTMTPAEYAAANLVPDLGIEFALAQGGVYLYWELVVGTLTNQEDLTSLLLPAIGGGSEFNAVYLTVEQQTQTVR